MLNSNTFSVKNINGIFFYGLFIVGIFLLSYLVLHKSFNLGLYGDDWLQLYNLWLDFDVRKTSSFFDLRSYLSPYWPQYIFLGIIRHFWDLNPPAYFYASFLLRVLATISLYPLTLELSKNKLAAIISCILFSVSAAGLETTDWVFNMNTYAGLLFFTISLTFYLKARLSKSFLSREYFLFMLFFSLAIFIVPVRMHGAIPLLISTDLFLTFLISKAGISKKLILRIISVLAVMFIFFKAGSYGVPEYSRERLAGGIGIAQHLISAGQLDFTFYFFGIVGNIIFPDSISLSPITNLLQSSFLKHIPFNFIIGLFSILCIFDFWLYQNIFRNKESFRPILILNLVLLLLGIFIQVNNPSLPIQSLFSIVLGAHLYILGLWIYLFRKNSNDAFVTSIVISILWISFFTIVYWLYAPDHIIETTGRYLSFGCAGVSIFMAVLISKLIEKIQLKKIAFIKNLDLFIILSIFSTLFIANFYAGQLYLGKLEKNRNQKITQKTWDTILKDVPKLDLSGPSVFYLTSDNQDSLYGVLTFGFWPRAGVIYKISDPENTPLPIVDYPTLLKAVEDGSPLKEIHARKKIPVPLSRVYSFDFRGGELINKTYEIRARLTKDLKPSKI